MHISRLSSADNSSNYQIDIIKTIESLMKITTKITFNQYVKLLYSLIYRKPLMKLLVGVASLLILYIVFYNLFNLPEPVIYQYLTLFFIAVVQPIGIFVTLKRNFYSSNYLIESLIMEMNETEIKITGDSFYMEVLWEKLYKIIEEKNWFLFYQNNLSAIIIPKKDLDNNEIEILRNILKNVKISPVKLLED